MPIRPANPTDIPFIRAIEQLSSHRPLIGQWSATQHDALLASPDSSYLVLHPPSLSSEVAGFAILRGLLSPHRSVELMRLAVATPGRSLGRSLLSQVLDLVFRTLSAHRLWLDVVPTNHVAIHLYREAGFQTEGTLRQADLFDGVFRDMLLLSLLRHEFLARHIAPQR